MLTLFLCFVASRVHLSLNEERQFLQWMRTNNKFYTGDEYHLRLGIFLTHFRYCQEFNRRNGLTFRVGINQFSCHTPAEYKALLGFRGSTKSSRNIIIPKPKADIPDSYDWRDKNVVNPVKDQGSCGSCWAFSAIATSESAYAIATGKLFQFSEQNLLDCAPFLGCDGGWPDAACYFIMDEQGGQFNSENDYPYTAVEGTCSFDASKGIGKITKVIPVSIGKEDDLKEKVATYGVASVAIAAANTPFMSYTGGILDNPECKSPDHAVACVGYGSENGVDFWIVRNSWGQNWGEEGYIRMVRNKDNQCSIASQAFVAIDSE